MTRGIAGLLSCLFAGPRTSRHRPTNRSMDVDSFSREQMYVQLTHNNSYRGMSSSSAFTSFNTPF